MFANGPDPNAPAPLSQQGMGDCVIADYAHQEMLRTVNVGTIWIPTDLQVLALYAYFQGMDIDPNSSTSTLILVGASRKQDREPEGGESAWEIGLGRDVSVAKTGCQRERFWW
jgi:hypothetical protein